MASYPERFAGVLALSPGGAANVLETTPARPELESCRAVIVYAEATHAPPRVQALGY